jgi:hypothetical protein
VNGTRPDRRSTRWVVYSPRSRGSFRASHCSSLWVARPVLVDAAFNTFLILLLGIIFLAFATLIYVLFYTPGVGLIGWEWFWVILAGLFDIGHWGASYTQRNQIPGARGA